MIIQGAKAAHRDVSFSLEYLTLEFQLVFIESAETLVDALWWLAHEQG